MEITKLRLIKQKNGNGLEMSYEKPGPQGDKIAVSGEIHEALIHNDFFNAIQALSPHLAMMAFHVKEAEVEDIAIPDPAIFKDFTVGSYSISGKDEKRGIIISGTLRKSGKAHNFNTPFYRFEEPESGRYSYMDDLQAILSVIESEVKPYLEGSKRGEAIQPEIPGLEGDKVTKMQIAKPEKGADKISKEAKHASEKDQHKYAGTEQMAAVAEMGNGKTKKNGTIKKVKQTADNPSGVINE